MRERIRVSTVVQGESMTKQSFRDEADINRIVGRFGIAPPPDGSQQYLDTVGAKDYLTMVSTIAEVDYLFSTLPAKARASFENSPANLLETVERFHSGDVEVAQEAHDLLASANLLQPRVVESPVVDSGSPVVDPAPGDATINDAS